MRRIVHAAREQVLYEAVPIDDRAGSLAIRRRVAYVAEDKQTYSYLTVAEMIRFTRSFYDDWRPDVERRLLADYALWKTATKVNALVITINEVTIVGRVQKPVASVDVSKIQPKLTLAELRQPFLDRIEEAAKKDPF